MKRALPLVAAFAAVIVSGLAHGLWTERWSASADLRRAADRLADIPLQAGDWEGQEEGGMSAAEQEMGQIEGYRKIRFLHRGTRAEVLLVVVCGRPGPIAVHTPNICFAGLGFNLIDEQKVAVEPRGGGPAVELTAGTFQKDEAGVPIFQRVMWTFSTAGDWKAPDRPRVTYSGKKFLYKIYVSRSLVDPKEPLETDPCRDLLRVLMPRLQKALFPPSPPA